MQLRNVFIAAVADVAVVWTVTVEAADGLDDPVADVTAADGDAVVAVVVGVFVSSGLSVTFALAGAGIELA